MQRLRRVALCSGLWFTACSCTNANVAWRCSTANGSFDVHYLAITPSITGVSGEMVFTKIDHQPEWQSRGSVEFLTPEGIGSNCNCAGIIAFAYLKYPKLLCIALSNRGMKQDLGSVPSDKPITFDLSLSKNGDMTLAVGTGLEVVNVGHIRREKIKLSCSGADVTFQNIKVH